MWASSPGSADSSAWPCKNPAGALIDSTRAKRGVVVTAVAVLATGARKTGPARDSDFSYTAIQYTF